MTEKERATEFLKQHHISGADFVYTTGFDKMVEILEAYAAQQSKMPTEAEMKKRQKDKGDYLREMGYPPQVIAKYQDAIKETWEWLRNQIER